MLQRLRVLVEDAAADDKVQRQGLLFHSRLVKFLRQEEYVRSHNPMVHGYQPHPSWSKHLTEIGGGHGIVHMEGVHPDYKGVHVALMARPVLATDKSGGGGSHGVVKNDNDQYGLKKGDHLIQVNVAKSMFGADLKHSLTPGLASHKKEVLGVSAPVSHIMNTDAKSTVVHEFTHHLDYKRTGGSVLKGIAWSGDRQDTDNKQRYYNSPTEFNAFYQGDVGAIRPQLSKIVKQGGSFSKFKRAVDATRKETRPSMAKSLSMKRQRRTTNRLYGLYQYMKNNPEDGNQMRLFPQKSATNA